MATVANCEAPGGYNYQQPQSFGGGVSAGGSAFGGGVSAGGSAFGGGANYEQVAIGGQTYEGQQVDAQLLEKIKQILLNEESKSGAGNGGFGGQPSSQYGAPQPQYGPPPQAPARVVGIILENTQPAIQVAQYRAQTTEQIQGGYAASTGGVAPNSNYAAPAPSNSYGAPAPQRPSSNYGAPF